MSLQSDASPELRSGDENIGYANEDDMFNAIVASLVDYTADGKNEAQKSAAAQEDRQLKEIMALSKLENEKKTGKLNLDFLKRNKQGEASPRVNGVNETSEFPTRLEEVKTKPSIVPAATASIPAPKEPATFVIKGPTGSNLPPPAMVTAVVRQGAGYD